MAPGSRAPESGTYDAFMSYSHQNQPVARWLHQALEFFGRTGRGRASRIFRDETNLGAGGALGDEIVVGLARSRRLILLASPESAASPWVRQELNWWWERHGSYRDVVVVLVGGEIRWDTDELAALGDAAAITTTDLVRFGAERLYVDLRERAEGSHATPAPRWWRSSGVGSDPTTVDAMASIAATLREVPKEVLVGNEVAWQRRTRRRTQTVVSVLSAAVVLAVAGLVAAVWQATEAGQERRVATARLLSSSAMLSASENGALARLLAVEGLRMHRDDLTLTALYDVADENPFLGARTTLDGEVTVLEGSGSGAYVLAATQGTTYLWDTVHDTTEPVDLGGERTVAADLDQDGDRIAIATDDTLRLWARSADGASAPTSIALENVIDVGLSDDDDVVAVLRAGAGTAERPDTFELVLVDTADSRILRTTAVDGYWRWVGVDGDEVVLVGHDGTWQRRPVADPGAVVAEGGPVAPFNGWIGKASPDAGHFGFVKHSVDVNRNSQGSFDETYRQGPIPGSGTFMPRLFELSPDGSTALVGGGNEVWVTTTDTEGVPVERQLSGAGLPGLAAFLDETRIVSAHGPTLVLWDLARPTGPWTALPYPVADGPTVGFSAHVALSDDHRSIAVVGGYDLVSHGTVDEAAGQLTGPTGGLPVWRPDGSLLLATGNEGYVVAEDGTSTRRLWTTGSEEADPWFRALTARIVGTDLYLVDDDGVIQVRDVRDGTLRQTIDPGFDRGENWNRPASATNQAALSDDGSHAAVVLGDASGVALVRTADGSVRTLTDTIGSVLIDGERVIVATGRDVRTFTLDGEQTSSFSMTGDYADALAVVPDTDVLARVRTDGRLVLANLTTGRQLADYAMPVPTSTTAQAPWYSSTLTVAGAALYSGTVGTDVARWDLSIPEMAEAACRAAGRDLSPQEWRAVTAGDPPADLRCDRPGLGLAEGAAG